MVAASLCKCLTFTEYGLEYLMLNVVGFFVSIFQCFKLMMANVNFTNNNELMVTRN